MALAEPRRRQKWTLNPRGNLWANDTDKFGQKLMEKMGWEQGKGLGANQDGMVDPIKLRHKDNSKGIGFEGHDDTWLAHQEDFQAVLAALNAEHTKDGGEDSDDVKQKSLEETSKVSRKRVHYQKFTRGKDLANYSTDDLGCILGTKSDKMKKKKKKKDTEATEEKTEVSEVGSQEKSHGLVVIQGGSYQEYFAKKMAELKAKGRTTYGDAGAEKSEEMITYTEETQIIGFQALTEDDSNDQPAEVEDDSNDQPAEPEDVNETRVKKKKKKKSKEDQESVEQIEEIESQAEPEQKKKKKSKKDKHKETEEEPVIQEENLDNAVTTSEERPKKSKKSKKDKSKEVEESVNEVIDEENLDNSAKKSKKKKNKEEEVQNIEDNTEEKLKKKKKKKGKKEKNSDPPEPAEKDSGCEEDEIKEKKKKKGKKEKKEEDEPERKRKHSEDNTEEPAKKKKKKADDDTNNKSLGFRGSNLSSINGYAQ